MRLSLLLLLLFIALQQPTPNTQRTSQPKQPQPANSQQTSAPDQRGTEQSPLVVKTIPTPKAHEETEQETKDRIDKAANDRHIVWLSGALVIIGFLQFLVYAYQAKKLRETVKSAGEQAEAMERHIDEAARSATAMENIASTIEKGNKDIMRSYLTVNIGGGTFQERNQVGQSDLKFGVNPTVANTGNTQARKVRIRKKAALLPSVLPENFVYEDLGPETEIPYATVAAHQSYTISALLADFVPDAEVASIKVGDGRNLHAWGTITYEDIFGDTHTTKFGQWIVFMPPDNKILGWYTQGQNDAD